MANGTRGTYTGSGVVDIPKYTCSSIILESGTSVVPWQRNVSTAYALKNGKLGMALLAQIAGVQGVAHNT